MSSDSCKARLAIHGGAGVIEADLIGPELERRFQSELQRIIDDAWEFLMDGADAVTAAERAVCLLEDCVLFNAGHGAVLNRDGVVEMDAAIMDGRGRRCGAVAAVGASRNPVRLARAVMEQGDHVLLVGPAAERFARQCGLPQEPQDYFITGDRRLQLRAAAAEGRISLDHDQKIGTVGAVARDRQGNLAAATSTGGMTNKLPGRVGDSPVIGAGTWADNQGCAVSATGHGEFLIRGVLSYDIQARMAYGGSDLAESAAAALATIAEMGGSAGLIAVDRFGNLCLPFNSPGMYRAWVGVDLVSQVAIY
jgi:beta-aspartyl-peptidase (threonine type)